MVCPDLARVHRSAGLADLPSRGFSPASHVQEHFAPLAFRLFHLLSIIYGTGGL